MRQHGRPARAFWVVVLGCGVAVAGCGGPRTILPKTDPRYEFESGRAEFERQHWIEAQSHLKRFLDLSPGNAACDSAQLLVGLAQYRTKAFAEAAVELALLPREYPRSDLKDDAGFWECMSYLKQVRSPQLDPTFALRAQTCFREFVLRYPETAFKGDSEARLGDIADLLAEKELRLGILFVRMKRPEAGLVYLQGLLETYPGTRWAAEARLWIGRAQEQLGRHAAAAETYRSLAEAAPDSEPGRSAAKRLARLVDHRPELRGPVVTPVDSSARP